MPRQGWQPRRRIYPDLHAVSLLTLRANQAVLDEREQETIQILELQGFPLLNIVHASITHQSSPFDDLIAPDAQQRWLASPLDLDHGVRPPVSPEQRLKQTGKLKRLQQRPDADRLIACWHTYLTHCIPRPAATEPAYWSKMPHSSVAVPAWKSRIASSKIHYTQRVVSARLPCPISRSRSGGLPPG